MKTSKYIIAFALLIFLITTTTSCNSYKKVQLTNEAFYGMKNFNKNFDRYIYIVHTPDSLTYLMNVDTLVGDSLIGSIEAIDTSQNVVSSKKIERSKVHLFISPSSEDNEIIASGGTQQVSISTRDVSKVEMSGKKRMGILGVLLTIVLVFVGLIVALLLILVAAVASDGSDSDIGSGGSDSDSGGGGGGGCYIATMAYGDINAPQVDSLRRFRDNVLVNYKLGRQFIDWYYAHSPSFVQKHQSKLWLHTMCRNLLNPAVKAINIFIK